MYYFLYTGAIIMCMMSQYTVKTIRIYRHSLQSGNGFDSVATEYQKRKSGGFAESDLQAISTTSHNYQATNS